MSSKKTQQTQQNTSYNNQNTYGFQQVPDTPDTSAFRDFKPTADPSIAYGAAASRNRLEQSVNNPLGGYQTGATRTAMLNSGNREIDQNASQAFRAGNFDSNQQRLGQLGAVANMTQPRMVQTSSSGTGAGNSTTSMTTPALDNVLSGASSAAMMTFALGMCLFLLNAVSHIV